MSRFLRALNGLETVGALGGGEPLEEKDEPTSSLVRWSIDRSSLTAIWWLALGWDSAESGLLLTDG